MPGTLLAFSLPRNLNVMPSCEMPYSALDPSIVAVFIESTMPAQSISTSMSAAALPTSVLKTSP